MRLFGLDPKSASTAGPCAELYARDSLSARETMHVAYPNDGWLDEARFDCGLLGAPRQFAPGVIVRYPTRSCLPPVDDLQKSTAP